MAAEAGAGKTAVQIFSAEKYLESIGTDPIALPPYTWNQTKQTQIQGRAVRYEPHENLALNLLQNGYKHFCSVCFKTDKLENLFRCSNCKKVIYCSEKCQKVDWKKHRENCEIVVQAKKDKSHLCNEDGQIFENYFKN